MAKILVVEDDLQTQLQVCEWLRAQGYIVESTDSGKDALQLLDAFPFDVIVLDWNLPDTTGIEICKRYRQGRGSAPILFLTAQGDLAHKEQGFDSGADDYLVKPFELKELSLRVKSLLRRQREPLSDKPSRAGWTLDVEARKLVSPDGADVRLTPRECAVLDYLFRKPGQFHSAKAILDHAWPSEREASEDTVRQCIRLLRGKLERAGQSELIETVLGSGYRVGG